MKVIRLLPVLCLAVLPSLEAAVIYSNDFSGTAPNVAFPNQDPAGNWSVSGGSYNLSITDTSTATRNASVLLSGLDAVSFTMETSLRATQFFTNNAYNSATIGFGLFGTDANFTGGSSNPCFLVDYTFQGSSAGQLRFVRIGGSNTDVGSKGSAIDPLAASGFGLQLNTDYTLRLDAVYNPTTTSLAFTFGLYNASGIVIGTVASGTTLANLTGDYFGFRNRIGQGGQSTSFSFDNFEIETVPEPSAAVLLLGGLAAVMLKSRGAGSVR